MNKQELDRIAFLLRNRTALPYGLAMRLHDAIDDYKRDPFRRSLDYHLNLPPRRPQQLISFVDQRETAYRNLAAGIDGSANRVTEIIDDNVEIWCSGDVESRSFSSGFREFFRDYQEFTPPFLKDRQVRRIITPAKVGLRGQRF